MPGLLCSGHRRITTQHGLLSRLQALQLQPAQMITKQRCSQRNRMVERACCAVHCRKHLLLAVHAAHNAAAAGIMLCKDPCACMMCPCCHLLLRLRACPCRKAVADALGAPESSLELSMGMSGDFEQAVGNLACLGILLCDTPCSWWRSIHPLLGTLCTLHAIPGCYGCRPGPHPCRVMHVSLSYSAYKGACCCCCCLQISMGSTNVRVGSTIFGARDYSKK